MEQITLYFKEVCSDKVYQAAIEPSGQKYVVNIAYGRRGSTLNTGTKTPTPVDYDSAKAVFDKLVKEKQKKGYSSGEDGTPYQQTNKEDQYTGVSCQLLNPVDEDQLNELLGSRDYWMQEKIDGKRLLIRKKGDQITGINRLGLAVGIPEALVKSANAFSEDFLLDGEAVGEQLHVFDILTIGETDLRTQKYRERYAALVELIGSVVQPAIRLVWTALETTAQKKALFDKLKAENKEGVVFKRHAAAYHSGRPASGGPQLKYKFCATASFIVGKVNGKRSVALTLLDGDKSVPAGNVTIPPNHAVPSIGSVVECRYLYAYKESGSIYQPVYLGQRDDIPKEECTVERNRLGNRLVDGRFAMAGSFR